MISSRQLDATATREKRRPRSVIVAATLQLLLAASFLIHVTTALVYGVDAQAAAEAEAVRQGVPAALLAENGIRFDEKGAGVVALAVGIGVGIATLALLNLAGNRVGRILSWIVHPVLLVAGGFVTAGQVFTVQFLETYLGSSDDAALENLDVRALVDAAGHAFPAWFPYETAARFALVTLGSLLVVILLAVPSAKVHFRKAGPAADRTA